MTKESQGKRNKRILPIVKEIYELRAIEHSDKSLKTKYSKAKRLINSVSALLLKQKDFVSFRPFWEELHDRMAYYYEYLNTRNLSKSKPMFRTTLHNAMVRWWMKLQRQGKLCSAILHFDTHPDMSLPTSRNNLLDAKGNLNAQGIERGHCGQIDWPITCLLLSKKVNEVIWCMPSWTYDDDQSYNQALVHSTKPDSFQYLREESEEKEHPDKYRIEIDLVEEINESEFDLVNYHVFSRVHTSDRAGWRQVKNLLESKKFILDIDLDYFVTNGGKYTESEYKDDMPDLQSDGRIHEFPGTTEPRDIYEDERSQEIIGRLNEEFKEIKKRVRTFLSGLKLLKQAGYTPCCIDISDSAHSFFSGSTDRAVFSNSYTPKYFVPALHVMLEKGLHELYGNTFV